MFELVLATNNSGKIKEIRDLLLDYPLKILSLDSFSEIGKAEETGETFEENALIKARYIGNKTGKLALADDSGLEVDALNGAPGVYSARFAGSGATDWQNNQKLLAQLSGMPYSKRTARFKCVIALYHFERGLWLFKGVCEGMILDEPRGKEGFGYDPLFYYPPFKTTFAELNRAQKNAVSHRGQALFKLQQNFDKILRQLEGQNGNG